MSHYISHVQVSVHPRSSVKTTIQLSITQ